MNHFKNNIMNDQTTTDAVNDLIEIAGFISVNALMVANGEAEPDEKDTGAWWLMLALCEAALSRYPEDLRAKGYELVERNVDLELAEKELREKASKRAEQTITIILDLMNED